MGFSLLGGRKRAGKHLLWGKGGWCGERGCWRIRAEDAGGLGGWTVDWNGRADD